VEEQGSQWQLKQLPPAKLSYDTLIEEDEDTIVKQGREKQKAS
jgi:hypothetical protein